MHFTSPAVASWPRLVVLLLLATITFAPGVEAAPVWRTSGDLLAAAPARVTRLDAAGIEAVIARLPGSLSLIRDYLRDRNVRVHLHTGDLTIDGSFANTHALVVDGNLTIRGSYDDYRGGGIGILVVLGDLRAEHVVSWGSMAVTGALHASGLVYAYYNDFTFEVAGPVRARAVVVFDKSTNDPRVEATVRQTDDGDGAALAVRHFVPELMVDDILDKTEADTQQLQAVASYDAAQDRIAAGLPIFRAQPGADSLPGDILRLFAPGLDAATRARLARADPLLALIVERMRARRGERDALDRWRGAGTTPDFDRYCWGQHRCRGQRPERMRFRGYVETGSYVCTARRRAPAHQCPRRGGARPGDLRDDPHRRDRRVGGAAGHR